MQNNFNIKPIISLSILVLAIFSAILVLGKVLIPFIVALILTYIVNPLVEKISHKFKMRRSIISMIISLTVFIVFLSIPLFIIPTLIIQLKSIITSIPDLVNLFNTKVLQSINMKYGTSLTVDFENIKTLLLNNFSRIYNNVNVFSPLAKNSFIIIEILLYIILIPFIMFYSINNWHQLIKFFDSLIPRNYVNSVHQIFNDIDVMLSAYLRGQISVMIIMAIYYAIALHFIGLTSGIVIGTMTGLLVFIPYLGILTGLLISLSIGFSGFHGMHQIFAILIAFAVGHVLEGGLVTPVLVGGKIGLNPIMIIFALMVFGQLFGLVGVLLALPLSTITVVLLKHAKLYYSKTKFYND
jgi:predicted PurR-regulated permease PerM